YKGKTWNYLVNGQTGEIQGEAPISAWKVAIAVVLGLLLIGGIIYLYSQSKQH
ncbi:MAG: primosomal protein N' (replication factor Y) - superfamily II helicase, partial [Armatimonadetes bacterium]|nr:primosomal protein N' (replication factor Y) - superfamily II helicase [Armatimonadota bacterium]